jgi:hypothetical protein
VGIVEDRRGLESLWPDEPRGSHTPQSKSLQPRGFTFRRNWACGSVFVAAITIFLSLLVAGTGWSFPWTRTGAASAHCAAHCGDTTRTACNRNTACDDARAGGTHTNASQIR